MPELPKRGLHLNRLAIFAWIVLILAITVRVALQPGRNSVYPIFAEAGNHWLAGTDLYGPAAQTSNLDQFRYAPIVASMFTGLSWLPLPAGEIVWRFLSLICLFLGFHQFLAAYQPEALARETASLAGASGWYGRTGILLILLLPMTLPSLNNGQANLLVIGAILFALAGAAEDHWWLCAVGLGIAILFKIIPFAIALLLMLVVPKQLGWRLLIVLTIGLLAPFVLQDPDYVKTQYRAWCDALVGDDRTSWELAAGYRDFRLLLRLVGITLSNQTYLAIQLLSAAGIAGIVIDGRWRGWPRLALLRIILDLGCCWMILFGPSTESSTYALIGPTLALAGWEAWARRAGGVSPLILGTSAESTIRGLKPPARLGFARSVWTRILLLVIVSMFVGSLILTALPGGKQVAYFLNPLAALLLLLERVDSVYSLGMTTSNHGQVRANPTS